MALRHIAATSRPTGPKSATMAILTTQIHVLIRACPLHVVTALSGPMKAEPKTGDDANANDHDDCLSSCELATCGDGVIWNEGRGTENCDDGNAVSELCSYGQENCIVCGSTCREEAGETSFCVETGCLIEATTRLVMTAITKMAITAPLIVRKS